MKNARFIVVFFCIFALLLAGGYYLFKGYNIFPEAVAPSDVLFSIQFHDVKKNADAFIKGPFGKALQRINWEGIWQRLSLPEEQKVAIRRAQLYFSKKPFRFLFFRLFGKDVGIFVYSPDWAKIQPSLKEEELGKNLSVFKILLITRLRKDAEFADFLSRTFHIPAINLKKADIIYKEIPISEALVGKENVPLYYFRWRSFLAISPNLELIKESIDTIKTARLSLARSPNYKKIRDQISLSPSIMVFANIKKVKGELQKIEQLIATLGGGPLLSNKKMLAKTMEGLESYGYAVSSGSRIRTRSILTFTRKSSISIIRRSQECTPKKNESFQFIPQDTIGYFWSGCMNPVLLWNNIKGRQGQHTANSQKITPKRQKSVEPPMLFGINLKDEVFPLLGKEAGGFVAASQAKGFIPIPSFCVFVKIKDSPKVKELFKKFESVALIKPQKENYQDIPMSYFSIPLLQNIQPGYCLLGNYALFASSKDLLKESIDVFNGKKEGLVQSTVFHSVNAGLTSANNAVVFIEADKFLADLRDISQWLFKWFSLQAKAHEVSQEILKQKQENIAVKIKGLEEEIQALAQANNETARGLIAEKTHQLAEARENFKKVQLDLQKAKQKESINPEEMQFFLNEVFYPLLDVLQSYKAVGLKTITTNGQIVTDMYIK